MTGRAIIFCPAGRRANMELQLPFMRRILADNPDAEFHIWNLARRVEDAQWMRGNVKGERTFIHNDFYGMKPREAFARVYQHYTGPEYQDCLFTKCDDDILFIETERFETFLTAVETYDAVISADLVNNGACALLHPSLAAQFPDMESMPLEAYQSAEFATESHAWFFAHWLDLVDRPITIHPCQDWLSIGLVGYTWEMGCRIAAGLGRKPPKVIAGRPITQKVMGDEGMVNTLPREILQGFTAAHLSFQPQHGLLPDGYWSAIREQYALIGKEYLETHD